MCIPTYCQLLRKVIDWLPRYSRYRTTYSTFLGQAHLDAYALEIERVAVEVDRYDDIAINSLRLSLEAIRQQAGSFAFW